MNNRQLTAFLHTRYATVVAALMLVSATVVAFNRGDVVAITGNRGLLWPSANGWIAPGFASMALNLAVNVAAAFFLVWVNKAFNVMRALTALWGTFFLMFQLAVPMIAGQFYGGTVMVVAIDRKSVV